MWEYVEKWLFPILKNLENYGGVQFAIFFVLGIVSYLAFLLPYRDKNKKFDRVVLYVTCIVVFWGLASFSNVKYPGIVKVTLRNSSTHAKEIFEESLVNKLWGKNEWHIIVNDSSYASGKINFRKKSISISIPDSLNYYDPSIKIGFKADTLCIEEEVIGRKYPNNLETYVIEKRTGKPLAGVQFSFPYLDSDGTRQSNRAISDSQGRVKISLPPFVMMTGRLPLTISLPNNRNFSRIEINIITPEDISYDVSGDISTAHLDTVFVE